MATPSILLRHTILALIYVLALSKVTNVSKEEYLKMKKYISFINRPPVKSFKTKYGDTFDCVNIQNQPALNHPLLQNHTIKMRPFSLPKRVDVAPSNSKAKLNFGLPEGGCPAQTVPIRRIRMGDLLRAGSVSNFMAKSTISRPESNGEHKYAVLFSKPGNYLGTEVSLSLWNPQLADESQFSLTQLWIVSGEGDQFNTIEAGWQVYPLIYNDNRTHLFVYWTADDYNSTGCYNLDCPGFVQVSQEISPASVIEPVSTLDGDQHELHLYVHKDNMSGDWWLTYGRDYHPIGYWPSSLFTSLNKSAELVEWGGETVSGILESYPPMGSGQFAVQGFPKSAYVKDIQVIDENGQKVDAPTDKDVLQTFNCYNLVEGGNGTEMSGRHFYYGGPGGLCND